MTFAPEQSYERGDPKTPQVLFYCGFKGRLLWESLGTRLGAKQEIANTEEVIARVMLELEFDSLSKLPEC